MFVDPVPILAAAPVGRTAQSWFSAPTADTPSIIDTNTNSEPIGVGTPERVNNPSIGGGGLDVSVRPRAELTRVERRWRHNVFCARREGSAPARVDSGQLARLKDARTAPFTALIFLPKKLV